MVLLDNCRLKRLVPTLIDIFGYEIGLRMGLPSVTSGCTFGDAVEGLKIGREDTVSGFLDVARDGSSLGVIGSWAGRQRVEVLGRMDDDVAPARSSACGGVSDDSGSGLVNFKEEGPSEEIG